MVQITFTYMRQRPGLCMLTLVLFFFFFYKRFSGSCASGVGKWGGTHVSLMEKVLLVKFRSAFSISLGHG